MRIPKYKAFYKFDETIYDVVGIYFDTKEVCLKKMIGGKPSLKVVDYHEIELMEYTGKQDIDGKDIYTGYILDTSENFNDYNLIVEFDKENGAYMVSTKFIKNYCYLSEGPFAKIIGNIYQDKGIIYE